MGFHKPRSLFLIYQLKIINLTITIHDIQPERNDQTAVKTTVPEKKRSIFALWLRNLNNWNQLRYQFLVILIYFANQNYTKHKNKSHRKIYKSN